MNILVELAHLGLDAVLAIATVCLAVYTFGLVKATQKLFIETKLAAEKQLGVNTWLEFVRRFDIPLMDAARRDLAQQIAQKLPTIGEGVPEFYEELGIAWNEKCIDWKLAHSSFSYDAQNIWVLVWPWIKALREERGEEYYCEYQRMLDSMRKHFPNDPFVTDEMAAKYLKTELGPSTLDLMGGE